MTQRSASLLGSAPTLALPLPLPQQVADGAVLGGERAGQQRHEDPEALAQLLHALLQAVDVRVQLAPAALHLRQHVVHQAVHLSGKQRTRGVRGRGDARTPTTLPGGTRRLYLPLSPCGGPPVCCLDRPESAAPS